MDYSIHGPFEIKRQKNGLIDRNTSTLKAFWAEICKNQNGLSQACGCYLFATRKHGILPWYIGLAQKQPFEKECFASHKVNIYNEVIANKKATPVLFLIAKRTAKNKFVKPSRGGHADIAFLESLLIGASLKRNQNLMNAKKTKYIRQMVVPGILNTRKRRPSVAEKEFKKVLG